MIQMRRIESTNGHLCFPLTFGRRKSPTQPSHPINLNTQTHAETGTTTPPHPEHTETRNLHRQTRTLNMHKPAP